VPRARRRAAYHSPISAEYQSSRSASPAFTYSKRVWCAPPPGCRRYSPSQPRGRPAGVAPTRYTTSAARLSVCRAFVASADASCDDALTARMPLASTHPLPSPWPTIHVVLMSSGTIAA
jgi:hypothetical protein